MLPRAGVPSDGLALELRGRKVEEMENSEYYLHQILEPSGGEVCPESIYN